VISLLYVLGLVCVAATLLALSRHEAWWIRACDFPRLQITAASLVVLVALAAVTGLEGAADWLLAAALLACIAYQVVVIARFTRLWPVEIQASRASAEDRSFSLLVVNVLMSNRQADGLFAQIEQHRPDVVLAVETDAWWAAQFEQRAEGYGFRLARPLDNTYGMLLWSRLELVEPELRYLLEPDVPSVRTRLRLRSGELVTLHGLHPKPPSPTEADSSAPRDAELILVAREVAEGRGPTVVAGDLNDVAWSHTSRLFRRVSGLLDPRVGRGMFNSFHAGWWPLRWPLDHVFVSADFLLSTIQRLPAFGSDHFPILIALEHHPSAVAVHDPPEADREDDAEADGKLEQVGLDPAKA
jgi:endonuclease/exonuclease/phosphatase (EEP) superfamily protein YafD